MRFNQAEDIGLGLLQWGYLNYGGEGVSTKFSCERMSTTNRIGPLTTHHIMFKWNGVDTILLVFFLVLLTYL